MNPMNTIQVMEGVEHGKLEACMICGLTPAEKPHPDDPDVGMDSEDYYECCCGVACVVCSAPAEFYCQIDGYGIDDYCRSCWLSNPCTRTHDS